MRETERASQSRELSGMWYSREERLIDALLRAIEVRLEIQSPRERDKIERGFGQGARWPLDRLAHQLVDHRGKSFIRRGLINAIAVPGRLGRDLDRIAIQVRIVTVAMCRDFTFEAPSQSEFGELTKLRRRLEAGG